MLKRTTAAVFLALSLGGAAIAEGDSAAPTADTVLATVNGHDITLGAVIVARQTLPEQYLTMPDDALMNGLLEQLVQQELLSQALEAENSEVRLFVENTQRSARAALKIDEIAKSEVTDAELQVIYDQTYEDFQGTKEYNASHILVETEDDAKALIEELNGGKDFAELAKEKSTGPSGPNGGSLGWFSDGMMVAPFEEAVKALEVGAVSGPVQTQFGWHVIKLNETRIPEAPALDEVRDALIDQIKQLRVQKVLSDLTADAKIERTDLTGFDASSIQNLDLVQN